MKKQITGFTLIEMLATLVIAGILFAAAGPSVRGIFTSNRMATHLNQLSTTLAYARSEAIKRAIPIAVGQNGSWASGWNVWIDNVTEDGILDTNPAETVLRNGISSVSSITLTEANGITALVYQPDGSVEIPGGASNTIIPTATISFTLCYSGQQPRILTISTTGKPEVSVGSTACP